LQHLAEAEYYEFKIDIIRKIVARLGCAPEIQQDIISIEPYSRRRVEFKVAVNKGEISLGFCEEKSNRVIDISMCAVIEKPIFELSKKLRVVLSELKKMGNVDGINITNFASGFDVFFLVKSAINSSDKEKIIEFAKQNNIVRLGEKIGDEELKILYNSAPVKIRFGTADIELQAGAFVQATQAGQDAITDFILRHIKHAKTATKKIADLYSGCGTYSFPIAQTGANVTAYEGDYEMVFALNAAARKNNLETCLQAQSRDLYKKPLRADELKHFDAIVVNPPRNGALPQCQEIAKSGVRQVLMVSCNPQTFERDAKCLLAAGYKLDEIVPIDQFLWSKHLELVAKFSK
jgi:23S rRNA (uracil1939-C5)-methyltransferase